MASGDIRSHLRPHLVTRVSMINMVTCKMNSGIITSDSCIALSLDDSVDVIFRLTLPFPDVNPTIISTHIVILGSFLRQLSPSITITTCYAPYFAAFLERTGEEHSTVH